MADFHQAEDGTRLNLNEYIAKKAKESIPKKGPGLVQVYTGSGKGKTTCSLGLALRALGQGFRVYMIQFLKSGDTGELFSAQKYLQDMKIVQFGVEALSDKQLKMFEFDHSRELKPVEPPKGFYFFPPDQKETEPCRRGIEHAWKIVMSGEYDIVILDEINCVLNKGLVPIAEVLKMIEEKPGHVELVLTGRGAPQEILEHADLVTEMMLRKHYF